VSGDEPEYGGCAGGKVVAIDAIADVPDYAAMSQAACQASDDIGLQRIGVDQINPVVTNEASDPKRMRKCAKWDGDAQARRKAQSIFARFEYVRR